MPTLLATSSPLGQGWHPSSGPSWAPVTPGPVAGYPSWDAVPPPPPSRPPGLQPPGAAIEFPWGAPPGIQQLPVPPGTEVPAPPPVEPTDDCSDHEQEMETPKRSRRRPEGTRFWCSFHLTEAYLKLNVVPAIIGKNGQNTRSIFEATGAKIRVRGRGSGHKEMATGKEAPTGLMVTVSAKNDNPSGFADAVKMTGNLLHKVQAKVVTKGNVGEDVSYGDLCWHISNHDGTTFRLANGCLVPEDKTHAQGAAQGKGEGVGSIGGEPPFTPTSTKGSNQTSNRGKARTTRGPRPNLQNTPQRWEPGLQ